MRSVLTKAGRRVIADFAWSDVLVAFDFDGTLAPIVARPDRAALRLATRRRLVRVAARYPMVIISGRSRADVRRRLGDLPSIDVIGNHGLEPGGAPAVRGAVRRWNRRLTEAFRHEPGVMIENKGFSLAVHYRGSRAKRRLRAAIWAVGSELPGARLIGGKDVVNVVPQGGPHKGTALERALVRHRCQTAIFVGDDDTDEDVFSLEQPGRLLAIRIGRNRRSRAPYYLPTQAAIDPFLDTLIAAGRRSKDRRP
jgi:trehalose 6-phosphate phosphatase